MSLAVTTRITRLLYSPLPKVSSAVGGQITVSVFAWFIFPQVLLFAVAAYQNSECTEFCYIVLFWERILLHTNITLFVLPLLICRRYYTSINIGNPARPYFLDVDTGTDLTWIQCDAPCTNCTKVHIIPSHTFTEFSFVAAQLLRVSKFQYFIMSLIM
jgi:hypothetical protein